MSDVAREQREPSAEARQMATAIRDHVDAMVREGFTEEAALRFLAVWMGTAGRPPEDPK